MRCRTTHSGHLKPATLRGTRIVKRLTGTGSLMLVWSHGSTWLKGGCRQEGGHAGERDPKFPSWIIICTLCVVFGSKKVSWRDQIFTAW